jgi:hypothetical protein
MHGLVQNYHPFQNISAWDEGRLGGFDDFLGHSSNAVCSYLSEYFKAHVQETNGSVLFDTTSIFFLGQEGYDAKV